MKTRSTTKLQLPQTICMRITRRCNACCRFCLAPDNAEHPTEADLKRRIDWLLSHGCRSIHFCGGEPTLHPALVQLLTYAYEHGAKPKLTTNGIELDSNLLPVLRATGTQVKISLHGPPDYHDRLVGRVAFCHAAENLKRLLKCRIPVSLQTTVVSDGTQVLDWMVDYCLQLGVRRLSILPFIPRGRGHDQRSICGLTSAARRDLRQRVAKLRRTLNSRLDLRWLDFTARPVHVLDADGTLLLEGMTESMDKIIYRIT